MALSALDLKKLLGSASSYAKSLIRRHEGSAYHDSRPIMQAGPTTIAITTSNFFIVSPTENVDTAGAWSSGTYTVPQDGVYLMHGNIQSIGAAGANCSHFLFGVQIDGTERARNSAPHDNLTVASQGVACAFPMELTAGQTVKFYCYQDTGSTLNVSVTLGIILLHAT